MDIKNIHLCIGFSPEREAQISDGAAQGVIKIDLEDAAFAASEVEADKLAETSCIRGGVVNRMQAVAVGAGAPTTSAHSTQCEQLNDKLVNRAPFAFWDELGSKITTTWKPFDLTDAQTAPKSLSLEIKTN